MKFVVKMEIALLVIVVLVAAGMILASEGVFDLFFEPYIAKKTEMPIPEEEVTAPPEVTQPAEETPEQNEPVTWQITAKEYFVYDIREEAYLLTQGDEDARIYPASITKLLTCYTVLQHMAPDTKVTVGDAMDLVQKYRSIETIYEKLPETN